MLRFVLMHLMWIAGTSGLTVTTAPDFARVKGDNITLPCSFDPPTTPDNYVLQWKKGNNTVYAFDDPGQDGPISAPGDKTRYTRENTDLHIRNFQLVDHGKFCCEIQTTTPPENVVECITAVFKVYTDNVWLVKDIHGVRLSRSGTYDLKQRALNLTVSYTGVHPAADLVLYRYIDDTKTQIQRKPKPTTADQDGLYSLQMDINREYESDATDVLDIFLEGYLLTQSFRVNVKADFEGVSGSALPSTMVSIWLCIVTITPHLNMLFN